MPQPNVTHVAFGDSATKEYPELLSDILGLEDDQMANESESGEEVEDGLDRLSDFIAYKVFPNAQYFLYWQGGNDLIDFIKKRDPFLFLSPSDSDYPFKSDLDGQLQTIKNKLELGINMAQQEGWLVYVATYYHFVSGMQCPPMIFEFMSQDQASIANEYVELLNETIRLAALNLGAIVVDIGFCEFELTDYENCNHLNIGGNQIVAQEFADTIGG
jgi:lysophospholipase L1-like esterase